MKQKNKKHTFLLGQFYQLKDHFGTKIVFGFVRTRTNSQTHHLVNKTGKGEGLTLKLYVEWFHFLKMCFS